MEDTLRIKGVLVCAGLRQTQVAKHLGVSDNSVSRVVCGKQRSQKIIDYLVSLGCNKRWFKPSHYPAKARKELGCKSEWFKPVRM